MSVLKSLKGTIQSVQQDLSSSFKSLTASKEKSSQQKTQNKPKVQSHHGANLDAGADLLHRHQDNWSDLHRQAEENASKAENLAIVIGTMFVTLDKQAEGMGQLSEEVKTFPTILQQLQDLTNHIANVEELCEQVEAAAIQLENICDIQDLQKSKLNHCHQLAIYKDKRNIELEKFTVQLAQQHAKKVKARDMKKKVQLKERQSIFQEAFDKDINYYRTFGYTERQPSVESDHEPVDLSEVKIDEDAEALDDFLASTDTTPAADRPLVFSGDERPDEESDSGVMNDREESPDLEHINNGDVTEADQTISMERDNMSKEGIEGGGTKEETVISSNSLTEDNSAEVCPNADGDKADINKTQPTDNEEPWSNDAPCLVNEILLVDELHNAGEATPAAANSISELETTQNLENEAL